MREKEIVNEIRKALTLIENGAANPTIQKKMSDFGFAAKNFKEGKTLAEQLTFLQRQVKTCYGHQYDATKALKTDFAALKSTYEDHLALARVACKNQPGLQTSLGLKGPRAQRRAEWTEQVASFYDKLSQQPQLLQRFGITPAEIEQAQAMVTAFQAIQRTQTQKKGEAQRNTRQRNEVRRQLRRWVRGFKTIAQLALQEDEELLEVLGMVVPAPS